MNELNILKIAKQLVVKDINNLAASVNVIITLYLRTLLRHMVEWRHSSIHSEPRR